VCTKVIGEWKPVETEDGEDNNEEVSKDKNEANKAYIGRTSGLVFLFVELNAKRRWRVGMQIDVYAEKAIDRVKIRRQASELAAAELDR
jgi:hypothetical protein